MGCLMFARNDGTHFGGCLSGFGEHRTCAADARGPYSTRLDPLLTSEHVPGPAKHERERSLNSPQVDGTGRQESRLATHLAHSPRTRSRPPPAALAWCCSTARGANCGRERVRGLYNLCRSHEALRAASPIHEQRGDVDHHRLPLLVFFRRQHGEGLAPLQSIDCTFHQRLLFC